MSKAPRITKAKFLMAMRRLKSGHSIEDIAADMGVAKSTVVGIRQAKTWPEYERRKAVKAARAVKAAKTADDKFARELEKVTGQSAAPVVPRSEAKLDSVIERLEAVAAVLEKQAAARQRDEVISAITNRRRGLFRRAR